MTSILQSRVNEKIKAASVRVIGPTGEMLGIMSVDEALKLAKSDGFDLIEVSPKADPPVVKIISFDKFRYQQEKARALQKKRQKKIEVKGIRLSVRIGSHDLEFKASQAVKFLTKGDKVKIELILRGREKANLEFAFEVVKKFLGLITIPYAVEQHPKKLGGIITTVIGPKS